MEHDVCAGGPGRDVGRRRVDARKLLAFGHWLQWVRPLLPGPNPFIARALTADTF